MDTLSHALWGYGLFGYARYTALAIFFGAMPDLISFGAFLFMQIIHGSWHLGSPPLATIPSWLMINYALGHSFVICLPIIMLVALWRKAIAFVMLGWPFHIPLDFPCHSLKYFPTPIFWPVADFKMNGIPWSHWYIWLPNIAGIMLLFYYRSHQRKRIT
ncbi:MAG: hypothetical protein EXR38_02985 [Methylotenera sp.]|nr:hypothetical protein [Methylotenera sp.]MSP99456.1 hypothetical protein [Methylotenera sp.]